MQVCYKAMNETEISNLINFIFINDKLFSFLFPHLPPTRAHTLQTMYSKLWLCIGIILIVLLNLLEALLKYL